MAWCHVDIRALGSHTWSSAYASQAESRITNRWSFIASIRKSWIYRIITVIIFFQWITWTWVFFRVTDIQQAFDMSKRMLHVNIGALLQHPSTIWIALFIITPY